MASPQWFLIVVVIPALLFLTTGMLRAPAATLKFTGMLLLICAVLAGVATGGVYGLGVLIHMK